MAANDVIGFVAQPGTDFKTGDEAEIAKRLDQLAKKLGVSIYGLSGYRTPSHSVDVGGTANDPHTKAQAADIGFGSLMRDSADKITDADLKSVGLVRPFPGAQEINHVQLADEGSSIMGTVTGAAKSAGGAIAAGAGAVVDGADALLNPVDTAKKAVAGELGNVWDAAAAKAEYAGLFVLLVAGGAVLVVLGLLRSSGLRKPQAAPA